MGDLDCLACHETLEKGHSLDAVKQSCNECHSDAGPDFAEKNWGEWLKPAEEALAKAEAALPKASQEVAEQARARIDALRKAGIWHNPDAVKSEADLLLARLAPPPQEPGNPEKAEPPKPAEPAGPK
jgi:hypothetical protein